MRVHSHWIRVLLYRPITRRVPSVIHDTQCGVLPFVPANLKRESMEHANLVKNFFFPPPRIPRTVERQRQAEFAESGRYQGRADHVTYEERSRSIDFKIEEDEMSRMSRTQCAAREREGQRGRGRPWWREEGTRRRRMLASIEESIALDPEAEVLMSRTSKSDGI